MAATGRTTITSEHVRLLEVLRGHLDGQRPDLGRPKDSSCGCFSAAVGQMAGDLDGRRSARSADFDARSVAIEQRG